ncbi:hypothetical protein BS600_29520 [Klebsiella pneumoniae]|nr:hypothetical protein BS600_29520 [Klebsiella pneumoniae]
MGIKSVVSVMLVFLFKQKTADEISACLVGSEMCIRDRHNPLLINWHCCKVSDEAAFCLIQRPYISKTLLTRRISPRGSP